MSAMAPSASGSAAEKSLPYTPNNAPGNVSPDSEVPRAMPTLARLKTSVWVGGSILKMLPDGLRREVMTAVANNRRNGAPRPTTPKPTVTVGDLLIEQVCEDPNPRKRAFILARLRSAEATAAMLQAETAPTPSDRQPSQPRPREDRRRGTDPFVLAKRTAKGTAVLVADDDNGRFNVGRVLLRSGTWGVGLVSRLEDLFSAGGLPGAVEYTPDMDKDFESRVVNVSE